MKPSPTMQRLITQLAAKQGIDLSQPHSVLRLTLADQNGCLVIESADGHHVSLARGFEDEYGPYADPYVLLLMDYPGGWLPLDLFYSPTEWEAFEQEVLSGCDAGDDPEAVELVTLTEYWAELYLAQGWLEKGVKDEARPPDSEQVYKRMAGCQSTNHTNCYGELWQCAACGKTVCYAEGTDNHPELCDDCWAQRYAPTLVLACDCAEEQCGAWLELTPDGFLALEDKDGLRVSLLLPEWLDVVMRTAIQEHLAADECGAKDQAPSAVRGQLEDDVSF